MTMNEGSPKTRRRRSRSPASDRPDTPDTTIAKRSGRSRRRRARSPASGRPDTTIAKRRERLRRHRAESLARLNAQRQQEQGPDAVDPTLGPASGLSPQVEAQARLDKQRLKEQRPDVPDSTVSKGPGRRRVAQKGSIQDQPRQAGHEPVAVPAPTPFLPRQKATRYSDELKAALERAGMDESTALSSPFIQELLAGADKGNKESAEELALHGTAGALGTAPWLFGYGEESKSLSQADIQRRLLEKQWDEVFKQHRERPSPLMRLADFGAHVAIPLYTVITDWDELSTGDKAIYGALDGLFLAWLAKTPARIAFRVAASEGTASARAAAGSAARTRQVVEATFRTRLGEISPSLVGPADDTIRAQRNLANVMVMLDEAERYSALMARRARTARGEVAPGAQEAARGAQAEIPRALEAVQLARQDLLSAAKKYVKTWEGAAKGVGVDDPSIMKGLDRLPQQMVTDTQRVVDATLDRSPAMARAETRARRTIRDLDELTRQVGETKMALDEMTTGLGHTPIRAAKYARELNTRLESTLTEAVKLANELSPHLESVLAQANKQAARYNDRFKALYKKTEALEPTVEIYADLTELKARAAALSTGSYRLFEDATGALRRLVTGFPEDRASWTQAMRQADEILATTRRQRNSARDSLEVLARGGPDWTPGSLASGPPAAPKTTRVPPRRQGRRLLPRTAGGGTGLSKRMRKDSGRLFPHLVTWKQGKLWKLHNLDTGRTTTRATRPMGARTVKPGPGLSQRSFQVLAYDDDPPTQSKLDLGAMRVTVDRSGITFRRRRRR